MLKKKILIDTDKCIGCGMCVNACSGSVIELVDGKARVIREVYCQGLEHCLSACPTKAISFVEIE